MRHHVSVVLAAVVAQSLSGPADAQSVPRHFTDGVEVRVAGSQPVLHYQLRVSDTDTTGWDVVIRVRNARDTFLLAMAKHPEYDDRFFRFVANERVEGPGATIVRQDSVLWRIIAPGGAASISYRIQLPPPPAPPRAAWRPFLTPTGGLTGGPHAFMYVVGAELAPAHVTVSAPSTWSIATGLTPTSDPRTFFAANAYVLVESPILLGRLRPWRFEVDGVPHTIAYWTAPNGVAFDTTAFRDGVERTTREAVKLFGRPPYREYVFQFQDLAFGGLEHPNSMSLGAPSADLARDPYAVLPEIAHEFVHTWNLMRIRPAEYVGVDYKVIQPVPTLWFSEGLTMHYADLLMRRAGLPLRDTTRTRHLEGLIARYLSQPGHARFSAEQISRVAYNAAPDALGDYVAGAHLVGELLGSMLDFMVRDATGGRRSMDDVMRLMLDRATERGFTGADVERAVRDVCSCNVTPFFAAHVRAAAPIDFNRYLALVGLRAHVSWEAALGNGQPAPDNRILAWNPPNDSLLALRVMNPQTVWGRAGLHTGDRVVSINGSAARTWPEFRAIVGRARIGDTVSLVVQAPRAATSRTVRVAVTGYDRPVVRIEPLVAVSDKQRRLREAWLTGGY